MFKDATSPTSSSLCCIGEDRDYSIQHTQSGSHLLSRQCSCIYPPFQGGTRKTTKCVMFQDPLVETSQPCCNIPSPTHHNSMRKTASLKVGFANTTHINGSKCKSPPSATITCTIKPILVHCLSPNPKVQSPKMTSSCTTAQVWDIMALKWVFPNSFITIGNMPSNYTIIR